jgi:DHA1 family bicyclomycin/chloramphenicol resistance-like MFS transporter
LGLGRAVATARRLAATGAALTDPRQPEGARGLIVVVALLSMLGPFTIDTYLPSFPDIQAELGVGPAAMAQTLSLYLLAFACTTLLWGPLSDSFGRRRVATLSLLIYVVASAGCALAPDFRSLLAFRALQGLAASGGMTIGRAVIRDVFAGPRAQRAMSSVMLLFALAPALAPIVGGLLHEWWGWRSVFVFLTVHGVAALALVRFAMPETLDRAARQPIHPRHVVRAYGRALAQPRFVALIVGIGCAFGGIFLYVASSPAIVFDHLGYGAGDFAVLFVPMVAGLMLGSFVSGRLAHRASPDATVSIAFAVMAAAVAVNLAQAHWLAPAPWNLIGPLVVYAFGAALAMPGVTLMALDCFPHHRGMASAAQGFVHMVTMAAISAALVPLVVGRVAHLALGQAALFAAALAFWGGVRFLYHRGRRDCGE